MQLLQPALQDEAEQQRHQQQDRRQRPPDRGLGEVRAHAAVVDRGQGGGEGQHQPQPDPEDRHGAEGGGRDLARRGRRPSVRPAEADARQRPAVEKADEQPGHQELRRDREHGHRQKDLAGAPDPSLAERGVAHQLHEGAHHPDLGELDQHVDAQVERRAQRRDGEAEGRAEGRRLERRRRGRRQLPGTRRLHGLGRRGRGRLFQGSLRSDVHSMPVYAGPAGRHHGTAVAIYGKRERKGS